MKMMIKLFVVGLILCSCQSGESLDPEMEKLGRATGPVDPALANSSEERGVTLHTGNVLEKIDVPNYTYLKIESKTGDQRWAAVPTSPIQVGQPVEIVQSLVMKEFKSPTLNRTFAMIIFGTLAGQQVPPRPAGEAFPPGHPPVDAAGKPN